MTPLEGQLAGLTTLLQLTKKARHAPDTQSLAFLLVNETMTLLRYDQATLARRLPDGGCRVEAVSGVELPQADAPYIVWLTALLTHLNQDHTATTRPVQLSDLPPALHKGWTQWGVHHGLWSPLHTPSGQRLGGLWLRRAAQPWSMGEAALLELLADGYAHAWEALLHRRSPGFALNPSHRLGQWIKTALALLVAVALLMLPVRLSVLAPATVAPKEPTVISAPLDGVVRTIQVVPNQMVQAGELLLELEDTTLQNELEVAKKGLEVAQAQARRMGQQAFADERSKAEVLLLQAQVEEKKSIVEYTSERIARSALRAPRAGVVLFNSVQEWIGKPVAVGQRIMTLADPNQGELEILLPVNDTIPLNPGAEVLLFLNANPGEPMVATLREIGYQPRLTPDNLLVYPLKADFAANTPLPRLGLRGIAKIHDGRVTLFYYLMRRPLTALRQSIGW